MGVALVRTAIKKYPWYLAPWQGILTTGNLTLGIVRGYITAIVNVFKRVPTGIQMVGPIGVSHMLAQAQQMGINYFISFLGLIAIYLAVFNILPIPPFDGGKLLFLGIEAISKKPVPVKIEQNITASLFILLLILMVWVTINDIRAIF
jgi:RIP metalloprotease RseP